MTRAAILADIHGNLPALEAVLKDLDNKAASAVFDLGDIVGYGPFPNQVVALLRSRAIQSVCGNADRDACSFARKRGQYTERKHALAFCSCQWTHDALERQHLDYLRGLPASRRVRCEGVELLLVHDSPKGTGHHLALDTSDEQLHELAELAHADVVACGHSHDAFVKQAGSTVFINAGTVGRGSRGDTRASYALVQIDGGKATATIEWVHYDMDPLLRGLEAAGLPDALVEMFRQGRQLAQVADLNTGQVLARPAKM